MLDGFSGHGGDSRPKFANVKATGIPGNRESLCAAALCLPTPQLRVHPISLRETVTDGSAALAVCSC